MEFTWEGVFWFILVLVVGSLIAGFIETALEDRKWRREQAEHEKYQRKGEEEMKGITFIEVLICIAILGILAAVVVPNLTRYFGS